MGIKSPLFTARRFDSVYESILGIFRGQKDGLTVLHASFSLQKPKQRPIDLIEKVETRAGNAHRMILSNNGNLFYVSTVRVHLCKGSTKHQATFCAREANDGQSKELTMKIPQNLYEVLLKYVRLNNPDLLLVLQVEGDEFKWGFTNETQLKKYSCRDNFGKYVV